LVVAEGIGGTKMNESDRESGQVNLLLLCDQLWFPICFMSQEIHGLSSAQGVEIFGSETIF
jgi:hypothetical protein